MSEVLEFGALKPAEGELGMLFLGQAGFLFTTGQGVLCVDPYLSNCVEKLVGPQARRMWWNSFETQQLAPDAVLITHDHLDHLDPETLPVFEQVSPPKVYFGPESAMAHLRSLRFRTSALYRLNRGDEVEWGGMRIKAVFAKHTPDSIGAVLRIPGLSVYITGDTCLTDELVNEDTAGCDVLIACANGIDENLSPQEAVRLSERLGTKLLIPMHYGLIPSSTVSPAAMQAALQGTRAMELCPEQCLLIRRSGDNVSVRRTATKEEVG